MTEIFCAKTVEQAKLDAIEKFKVSQDRIVFEVLEEPKKSLFGKTKSDAKISASYEPTKGEVAAMYLKDVVQNIGITDVQIKIDEIEGGSVLTISGDGCESIIGKKGEVLDSLQYLASLVCNRGEKDYYRISVDCQNYREKRKKQLETLAQKVAENVKKNCRSSALEPMNPFERRIVHSVVSSIEGVSSHSVGNEPYRKVIIASTEKRKFDKKDNRNNGQNKGFNKNKRREQTPAKSFDIKTSFEKDYKKPKPEDSLGSGLYSKIEF